MNQVISGNKGKKVRSDCMITVSKMANSQVNINLTGKVKTMYGRLILQQIHEQISFYGIQGIQIDVEDSGALPFTISARIEAAITKIFDIKEFYIPDIIPENQYQTTKDRFRFSRLYIPGNTPSMMINAGLHKPNGIILDLEDAVAPEKKDEARFLVRNALCQVNFYGAERMVRINQGERGLKDLEWVVPYFVNMILIPKVETPQQIQAIDNKINELREKHHFNYPIWYMPILESALGIENAFSIATASNNIAAMAIGLEDYTADIGVQRTKEGTESLYARMRLVNAAKAASIQPIDSVFSDISDMEGLLENVKHSKTLGFEGMGCIHPRQIAIIHQGFAPGKKEYMKNLNYMIGRIL
ncbi:MAG TPA: citrate lyase ACP [Flavobacteriaceae bacterium]|nr:citrate lyase ACP [Flavobacteriaceae bacterium]